tara:strand:- start:2099 stop:2458 length:360 start_codon:yes stop_codon:yes gene_type:complete
MNEILNGSGQGTRRFYLNEKHERVWIDMPSNEWQKRALFDNTNGTMIFYSKKYSEEEQLLRLKSIIALRDQGYSMSAIARHYKISRERVRQLLKPFGKTGRLKTKNNQTIPNKNETKKN